MLGNVEHQAVISIHAPRAGSDVRAYSVTLLPSGFQSTLPVRGATQGGRDPLPFLKHFNPRSPCGERHSIKSYGGNNNVISIHAPRAGSDLPASPLLRQADNYFNPRSPCGERQLIEFIYTSIKNFNPRSPCGERPHGTLCWR